MPDQEAYGPGALPDPGRDEDPRLHELADEQAALRRVATLVAHGISPDELFSAVSKEVGRLFGAETAISRYEADGSAIVVVGLTPGMSVASIGTRWPLEDFMVATAVYRTGRSTRTERHDLQTASGPIADSLRRLNVVSTVAAPIVVEGDLWGVMTVANVRKRLPPDAEERLAKFTELVGTAIANVESRAELASSEARARDLGREQAALRRVATLVAEGTNADELFSSVSNEVGGLFGAQAAVARFETDGSAMVVVGLTSGIPVVSIGTRWPLEDYLASTTVFRTGRPARNDHTGHESESGHVADSLRQMDFVSTVAAPITVEGNLWGVMTVSDQRKPLPPDTEERVARFTELVGTAIANAESRAELAASEARSQELAREQAALRRVATMVAKVADPEEVFSEVSNEVGRLFGSDQAAIGRYEPDGSGVVYVGISEGLSMMPVGTRWPLEDFLASTTVYRTGRPARQEQNDYETASGSVADTLRDLKVLSRVGAPIVVEGKLWGVLLVTGTDGRLPPAAEERVAKFADLVATAIANADSRSALAASEARAHDLAREQAALRRVATRVVEGASAEELFAAVATEVADVVGIPVVGLCRYEVDSTFTMVGTAGDTSFTVGSRWPVTDDGLAGMILATRHPARKDDYATMAGPLGAAVRDDRMIATVGVPIIVEGDAWGFIVAAAKPGTPIPDGTEERLTRFTELVATAIANSQAREHVARLVEEQAALRRVATLVARGGAPSDVFALVSTEIQQLFGSDMTAVARHDPDGSDMVVVGLTRGASGVSIGTRWPLENYLASTAAYRTGRPARADTNYLDPSGPVADSLRQTSPLSTVATPIVVEGKPWGVIAVSDIHRELPPDTEERMAKFTELVATAIANAEGRAALTASRARVVAAGDEARQRIERDLHDGAQQRLVTLAVALQRAQSKVPPGSDELRADVSRVAEGLITAVNELRELSQGIHPAELTEGGLSPALKALGRRSAIRVELDVPFEQRLPDQVEVAAYYTVSEALTNASKHANATRVWVRLHIENDVLHLSIRDDGTGGADPSRGSGLTGLRDRIEALRGSIVIESPPGRGTRIEAEIPIHAPADEGGEPNESPSPVTAPGAAR